MDKGEGTLAFLKVLLAWVWIVRSLEGGRSPAGWRG